MPATFPLVDIISQVARRISPEFSRQPLNTYLDDPDDYRAITRHLLHQPGHISFQPDHITVTIRRPDAPRIATALNSLTHQLNTNPPHLVGDHRPITYHLTPKP